MLQMDRPIDICISRAPMELKYFHFIVSNINVPTNKSNKKATLMKKYISLHLAPYSKGTSTGEVFLQQIVECLFTIFQMTLFGIGIPPVGTTNKVGIAVGMVTVGQDLFVQVGNTLRLYIVIQMRRNHLRVMF